MNLKEYLSKNNLSVTDFSAIVNCSRGYISHIVNGRIPGRKLAQQIENKTKKQVTVEELRRKKQDIFEQYELPIGEI